MRFYSIFFNLFCGINSQSSSFSLHNYTHSTTLNISWFIKKAHIQGMSSAFLLEIGVRSSYDSVIPSSHGHHCNKNYYFNEYCMVSMAEQWFNVACFDGYWLLFNGLPSNSSSSGTRWLNYWTLSGNTCTCIHACALGNNLLVSVYVHRESIEKMQPMVSEC